jgi:hypothetical protein
MARQYSAAVRNAQADAWETAIGTSAVIKIRTGAQPATVATADSGTVLATFSLASDWCGAASAGAKVLNSLPVSTTASATGTAAHYRIYASDGTPRTSRAAWAPALKTWSLTTRALPAVRL